jgi:hypothetical protein
MKKYKLKDSAVGYINLTTGQVYAEDEKLPGTSTCIRERIKDFPEDWEEVKEEASKEPLDLTKILKGCEGQTFYCTIFGEVTLDRILDYKECPIEVVSVKTESFTSITKEGFYTESEFGECILFPSKENRDWSTFKPKIPFGTPVMVSNNGTHWKLKKYNEILQNTYIVPVDRFDFSNFEAKKY